MRPNRPAALAVLSMLALSSWPIPASADVRVTFLDPGRFRDSDRAGGVLTPLEAFGRIAAFLKRQGKRLPAGQDIHIQIVDFNLAGILDPFRPSAQTTRFLGRTTWPSFRIRYSVQDRGRVVAQVEELVADREYLSRPNTQFAEDPLKFEKNLLYDWFDARFVLGRPALPPG